MGVITLFDKIICEDSNLKKRICLIYVLTVALFSCLGMICEFRHLKFFKLLLDRVNLLNQLYWYLWSYCKRRVLYIYVCFEFCYLYYYFFFILNSVYVNNVKIRSVLVILEKAVVREVALFFLYYCILCWVNWQLMIL